MAKGKKASSRAISKASSSNTLRPIAQARKDLEDEIRTHSSAIISMKHKLNELTTIACLPPELLTEIFLHYAALERASPSSSRPTPYTYSHQYACQSSGMYRWIRITHVCHHWRSVALASPRLWATISVTSSISCVREMVKRAKHAPLDIRIGATASLDALKAAFENGTFSQIRRLEIPPPTGIRAELGEGAAFPTDVVARTQNAPQMRALSIKAASANLLDAFEKCAMPNLEELELVGVFPKWTSPLLVQGLTRLVLSSGYAGGMAGLGVQGMRGVPQSLARALEALESLPLLEHLELRNILPRGLDTVEYLPPEDRVVSLANLKALNVTDEALACAQLLRHISFPAATPLVLDCRALTYDIEPLGAAVASKLSGVNNASSAPTIRTACFSNDPGRITRLKCWTSELEASPGILLYTSSFDKRLPTPLLDIRLTLTTETTAFSSLFGSLPLNDLKSLCIQTDAGYETLPKNAWVRCCEGMLSLRSLSVGRWAEGHLADVLAMRIPLLGTDSEPVKQGKAGRRKLQPFWPALEELRLQGVRLRPFYYDADDKLLGKLQRAFEKRKKSKHAIDKLTIWGCFNARAQDVKTLEGSVGKVRWDGQDVPAPEYEDEFGYGEDDDSESEMSEDGFWDDEMDGMDEDDLFPWELGAAHHFLW